jgi:flavin-dependent dehydrogenase
MIHVPGARSQIIECKMPLAWRKDLDFWMVQQAQQAGVEVRDGVKVTRVEQNQKGCTATLIQHALQQELKSRFVIGADGAASAVRKSLWPKLKVRYTVPTRECYQGALDLQKDYFHWFFPRYRPRPRFGFNHKGDCFLIEGSGIKELANEISQILAKYGFNPGKKPLWKDGCLIPRLHEALISAAFSPAGGNILLVGDAAGLILPITFEGIGTALKSGCMAADSIIAAARSREDAAGIYLRKIESIMKVIKSLQALNAKLEKSSGNDPEGVALALKNAYAQTLQAV